MREIARFEVLGSKCVPWSVPFFGTTTGKGGRRRHFAKKDAGLIAWQERVAEQARLAMGVKPVVLGPVLIDMTFFRVTPPGKREGDYWSVVVEPTSEGFVKRGPSQPDLVNLFKGTEDALQGVLLANDVQTCAMRAERRYGPQDGVAVAVYALDGVGIGSLGLVA
jgi:Holliday junction resolvase RusA-like endonuclease